MALKISSEPRHQRKISLDKKDKKILFALDFHARASYASLAKEVGLSKQTTEYKIKRFVQHGLITGFYPVINVPKLGYLYCRVMITLQQVNAQKKAEILKFLQLHPQVFWLFTLQGMYDLSLVIWAKSLTVCKHFIAHLEERYGTYIKRHLVTLATDVVHLQHRYLLGREETKEIHIRETDERMTIDPLDKAILHHLCKNARTSLVALGTALHESPKVISYRIRRLEKEKFIVGYRPLINHHALGYTYYKLFINLNSLRKQERTKLLAYIKQNPYVIYIVEGIGLPADIDLELMVPSNDHLFQFIDDLKFTFPALVGDYTSVVFLDTLKVNYLPS